jgi:hypothetical protein
VSPAAIPGTCDAQIKNVEGEALKTVGPRALPALQRAAQNVLLRTHACKLLKHHVIKEN